MTDLATTLRRWSFLVTGLLVVALVSTGCDAFTDDDLGDANPQPPTIAQYIQEIRAFSSLEVAVDEVGLTGTLDGGGPFTVFAPLNEAFSPPIDPSLNQEVTRKVLRHHTVSGQVTSGQLRTLANNDDTRSPLAGQDLSFRIIDRDNQGADTLKVNRAIITNPDAEASNGVVHVIDGLLIDAVDRTTLTPRFTIFARLLGETGLDAALREPGANDGRTIFAPTNEALLSALDSNGNGSIEDSEIPSNAADILQYHVLDNVFLAEDVPTSETAVTTLEGSDLTVVRSGDAVTLNPNEENASVTTANVEVDNGVIHGIDTVLSPPADE